MTEINHLIIDTEGTKEEAVENLKEALEMEIKLGGGNVTKGEEGGDGNLRSQGDLEFLTQDKEPSGTTPIDARNRFNELIHLEMLWTVRHRCPAGARFAFN